VALRERGLERSIVVRLPHFLVAPLVVASSDLLMALPERLVRSLLDLRSFARRPLPLEVGGFDMKMFWHPRDEGEAAHRWLRSVVQEVAKAS